MPTGKRRPAPGSLTRAVADALREDAKAVLAKKKKAPVNPKRAKGKRNR